VGYSCANLATHQGKLLTPTKCVVVHLQKIAAKINPTTGGYVPQVQGSSTATATPVGGVMTDAVTATATVVGVIRCGTSNRRLWCVSFSGLDLGAVRRGGRAWHFLAALPPVFFSGFDAATSSAQQP
jgi:hypothetical protein